MTLVLLALLSTSLDPAEAAPVAAIVDYSSRTLYLTRTAETFLIAVPYSRGLWRTGYARVTLIEKDPIWIPTPNVRQRKLAQGIVLKKSYRPYRVDRQNPLGSYMIRFTFLDTPGDNLRGIHGTNDPTSIGKAVTSGCFRNYNQNITRIVEERLIVQGDLILLRL